MQNPLQAHESLTYQAVCFMHNQDIENQGYACRVVTKITGSIIIICSYIKRRNALTDCTLC